MISMAGLNPLRSTLCSPQSPTMLLLMGHYSPMDCHLYPLPVSAAQGKDGIAVKTAVEDWGLDMLKH